MGAFRSTRGRWHAMWLSEIDGGMLRLRPVLPLSGSACAVLRTFRLRVLPPAWGGLRSGRRARLTAASSLPLRPALPASFRAIRARGSIPARAGLCYFSSCSSRLIGSEPRRRGASVTSQLWSRQHGRSPDAVPRWRPGPPLPADRPVAEPGQAAEVSPRRSTRPTAWNATMLAASAPARTFCATSTRSSIEMAPTHLCIAHPAQGLMRRLVDASGVRIPVPVRSWPRWSRRIPTRIAHGIGHGHARVFVESHW